MRPLACSRAVRGNAALPTPSGHTHRTPTDFTQRCDWNLNYTVQLLARCRTLHHFKAQKLQWMFRITRQPKVGVALDVYHPSRISLLCVCCPKMYSKQCFFAACCSRLIDSCVNRLLSTACSIVWMDSSGTRSITVIVIGIV